jgi:hypothetical protein
LLAPDVRRVGLNVLDPALDFGDALFSVSFVFFGQRVT